MPWNPRLPSTRLVPVQDDHRLEHGLAQLDGAEQLPHDSAAARHLPLQAVAVNHLHRRKSQGLEFMF